MLALALTAGCVGPEEPSPRKQAPPEGHGRHAIFRGAGNEPGWNIEIGPAKTVLVTSYGEERHEFATPDPVLDEPAGRTTYGTSFDGHEIVVILTHESCNDTMSDETFPLRVRIELDDRELRGCGVELAGSER